MHYTNIFLSTLTLLIKSLLKLQTILQGMNYPY